MRYDMISPDIAIEQYVKIPILYNPFNDFDYTPYKINLNNEIISYNNEF
jgi:hypothetical protein